MSAGIKSGFIVAVLIACSLPRFLAVEERLPYYAIDENDIVETAVAVTNDWPEYYIYQYGSAFINVLAGVFRIWGNLFHDSVDAFNKQIFFDNGTHYFLGRSLVVLILTICVGAMFFIGRRWQSTRAGVIAAILMALPFIDILMTYSLRLDAVLAVTQFASLVVAVEAGCRRSLRLSVVAGLLSGL